MRTFVSIPLSFLACCISLMWSFCISFSYSSTIGHDIITHGIWWPVQLTSVPKLL